MGVPWVPLVSANFELMERLDTVSSHFKGFGAHFCKMELDVWREFMVFSRLRNAHRFLSINNTIRESHDLPEMYAVAGQGPQAHGSAKVIKNYCILVWRSTKMSWKSNYRPHKALSTAIGPSHYLNSRPWIMLVASCFAAPPWRKKVSPLSG